jgi:hypothetical protein
MSGKGELELVDATSTTQDRRHRVLRQPEQLALRTHRKPMPDADSVLDLRLLRRWFSPIDVADELPLNTRRFRSPATRASMRCGHGMNASRADGHEFEDAAMTHLAVQPAASTRLKDTCGCMMRGDARDFGLIMAKVVMSHVRKTSSRTRTGNARPLQPARLRRTGKRPPCS